ncbi:MAG: DUF4153 domain-containing protein [Rhodospirillaceae bacterium]
MSASRIGLRRLAIGLAQGLALYLMFQTYEARIWPATDLATFQAILLPLFFAPLAAIRADGHLPPRKLMIGLGGVVVLTAALGAFEGYRVGGLLDARGWEPGPLLAGVAFILFLGEALVVAGETDGKRLPRYQTYFEALSKHAVQLGVGVAFLGALWVLLYLGGSLFNLIKLEFLLDLIEEPWFAIPISTTGLAIAVHVTDMRGTLVRGLRTLAHALLSWLLPVLTLITLGFLASLPFTGLQPLWDTRFAAGLLLAVAAALIVLINAVYEDGAPENQPRGVQRWSMMAAMALPAPLVAIAAHALFLRVGQYGWTTERVFAFACILIGGCFGVGYLAALARGMKRLEETNMIASFSAIAVILALLTPVADPVRISVASQVARLEDGRTAPEAFDYRYLRFEGGRYGASVLARMQAGEFKRAGVADRARQAANLPPRFASAPIGRDDLPLNITVAGGRALPESFLAQDWAATTKGKSVYPACLTRPGEKCEAFLLDLTADGSDEILLLQAGTAAAVLRHDGDRWLYGGFLPHRLACDDMRALLRSGEVRTTPSPWSDLEIGGVRMDVAEGDMFSIPDCP